MVSIILSAWKTKVRQRKEEIEKVEKEIEKEKGRGRDERDEGKKKERMSPSVENSVIKGNTARSVKVYVVMSKVNQHL